MSTKQESQATAKFVRGQEEPGGAAQNLKGVSNPSSTSAGCFTQHQGLPTRLSAPDSLGPEKARQILPSARGTAWCSLTDVISLSTCHSGGKKAAHNQLGSVQRFMQAVSTPQNSLPRVTLQAPGIKGFISVSSPSQFPIRQRNRS